MGAGGGGAYGTTSVGRISVCLGTCGTYICILAAVFPSGSPHTSACAHWGLVYQMCAALIVVKD